MVEAVEETETNRKKFKISSQVPSHCDGRKVGAVDNDAAVKEIEKKFFLEVYCYFCQFLRFFPNFYKYFNGKIEEKS